MDKITQYIHLDTNWTEKVVKSDAEWKKILTPKQYAITRQKDTERAFCSDLNHIKNDVIFYCVCCRNPLFDYSSKFESGTGWPSFWKPISTKSIKIAQDRSHGMIREEVLCARCDAHLGHVFNDSPTPTGLRYCMNGEAMLYQEKSPYSTAVFALGCFWCVEEIFEHIKGVHEVISGYSGGHTANPTYEQVGMGRTGHAESILVKYDPALVSYEELLKVYFKSGDITQVNGQGPDDGDQYRSIIFYDSENQRDIIQNEIKKLENSGEYKDKISIEIKPFDIFYVAEDYHQDFVKLNPNENYVKAVSKPRFVKAITSFKDLLKSDD